MTNLVGTPPNQMLLHGPSKLLVHNYHWHSPKVGIVASYTPNTKDVEDHFGVFRGVDQIEAFAQGTIGSLNPFLECIKQKCTPAQLKENYIPAFISIGQVFFSNYVAAGDTFVSLGVIKFHKFRQMVADGRIYKTPKGLDLDKYFNTFNENRLRDYDLSPDFTLVAELFDITGRAIKINV
ncbi:MAG: hypothetical protein EAZ51_03975 [Sphingobacteriales bacterium]|nr:MAG: hypothetical protein EAZ64_03750 [Sphingobacteriales bacterium]TAF81537.1 MAG: hypothetical protein EAZ51_03975 [Sphingobacteriales bacterium]